MEAVGVLVTHKTGKSMPKEPGHEISMDVSNLANVAKVVTQEASLQMIGTQVATCY